MDLLEKPVPRGKTAIGGVVADPTGKPLARATVLIAEGPAHPDIAAMTNALGHYRFDNLTPGRYTILVNPSGRPQQRSSVTGEAGKLARLDFHLD